MTDYIYKSPYRGYRGQGSMDDDFECRCGYSFKQKLTLNPLTQKNDGGQDQVVTTQATNLQENQYNQQVTTNYYTTPNDNTPNGSGNDVGHRVLHVKEEVAREEKKEDNLYPNLGPSIGGGNLNAKTDFQGQGNHPPNNEDRKLEMKKIDGNTLIEGLPNPGNYCYM